MLRVPRRRWTATWFDGAWSRLLCPDVSGDGGPLRRDGRGPGDPGDVGWVRPAGPPDRLAARPRGARSDKDPPVTGCARRPAQPRGARVRRRGARGGCWRWIAGGASSSAIGCAAASSSSLVSPWLACDRPLELAAPRKNKGPGGWSRPGLWFTRGRRGSGRHSDERDATEVTGGHPGLGTTTGRRQLHSHGGGYAGADNECQGPLYSP